MRIAIWLLAACWALGCEEGPPPDEAPPPLIDEPAGIAPPRQAAAPVVTTRTFVVTDLTFVDFASAGVADGFDLDGVDGNAGCGHVDYVAPDGRAGIDNQLAGLMPVLRMTEAAAIDGLVQESVNNGLTMFIIDVEGLDDGTLGDDEAVRIRVRQGAGPKPILDTEGRIEADQTFRLNPDGPDNEAAGHIADGVLRSEPFAAILPAQVLGAQIELDTPVARIELVLNADGSADGILGGAVRIEGLVDLANSVATSIGDLATALLRSRADLLPDADGRCTAMSAYFRVHLEPAFIADW